MNDQDTNLYYLQSRYYNPATGRFINADALASTGQGLTGNNMFAYCGNNPANGIDPEGFWTVSYGINISLDCFAGGMLSIQKTIDSAGNVAIQGSYSIPGVNDTYSIGGVSVGAGAFFTATGLDTYADLEGHSVSAGTSVGEGPSVGVDLVAATSSKRVIENMRNKKSTTFDGAQLTFAWAHGVDVHYTDSYTTTLHSYNLIDTLRSLFAGG